MTISTYDLAKCSVLLSRCNWCGKDREHCVPVLKFIGHTQIELGRMCLDCRKVISKLNDDDVLEIVWGRKPNPCRETK